MPRSTSWPKSCSGTRPGGTSRSPRANRSKSDSQRLSTSDSSARRLAGARQKHGPATMYLVHEDRSPVDAMWADRAQLCVARTVTLPFTAAIARFVGRETPDGLDLDPYWKRDRVGPL